MVASLAFADITYHKTVPCPPSFAESIWDSLASSEPGIRTAFDQARESLVSSLKIPMDRAVRIDQCQIEIGSDPVAPSDVTYRRWSFALRASKDDQDHYSKGFRIEYELNTSSKARDVLGFELCKTAGGCAESVIPLGTTPSGISVEYSDAQKCESGYYSGPWAVLRNLERTIADLSGKTIDRAGTNRPDFCLTQSFKMPNGNDYSRVSIHNIWAKRINDDGDIREIPQQHALQVDSFQSGQETGVRILKVCRRPDVCASMGITLP